MFKLITAIAFSAALVGCEDGVRQLHFPAMPDDMKDCKIVRVSNSSGAEVVLARCPLSVTSATVKSGKVTQTTITVDGVEYISKEK